MSDSSTEVDTDAFGEAEEIYAIKCDNSSALFLRCINKVFVLREGTQACPNHWNNKPSR